MIPIIIATIEDPDDREFMSALYMQYRNLMYKVILEVNNNSWDAEDIIQEVLVKLIDKISTLKGLAPPQRLNYIAVSCKNTAYNYSRNKKNEVFFCDDYDSIPADNPSLDDFLIQQDEYELLASIWPSLDEKTKYLLNGKYILQKSAKELAAELNMPPDNIRMALVRAKRKVRKALADAIK